jgi:hypothetical protein
MQASKMVMSQSRVPARVGRFGQLSTYSAAAAYAATSATILPTFALSSQGNYEMQSTKRCPAALFDVRGASTQPFQLPAGATRQATMALNLSRSIQELHTVTLAPGRAEAGSGGLATQHDRCVKGCY